MGSFLGIGIKAQRDGWPRPCARPTSTSTPMRRRRRSTGGQEPGHRRGRPAGPPVERRVPDRNADTNLSTLWARIGGTLADPPNMARHPRDARPLAVRPGGRPYKVRGQGTFTMSTPVDPADPDGPFTTEIRRSGSATTAGHRRRGADQGDLRRRRPGQPGDQPRHRVPRRPVRHRVPPGNDPAAASVTPGSEPGHDAREGRAGQPGPRGGPRPGGRLETGARPAGLRERHHGDRAHAEPDHRVGLPRRPAGPA